MSGWVCSIATLAFLIPQEFASSELDEELAVFVVYKRFNLV